jgi:translation initiation factor 1A
MPKNTGRGGKNRRRGKPESAVRGELHYKEEDEEYAQVVKLLGQGRLEAKCFDGKMRLCKIRGKMRKKIWIKTVGSLRCFDSGKRETWCWLASGNSKTTKEMLCTNTPRST